MTWVYIKEWLESHGYINPTWNCIEVNEDGFYAEDKIENTFISIFTHNNDELVLYVGCLQPKVSVGSSTGYYVSNCWDVIDFLDDSLENMYDELMKKIMNEVNI